MHILTHSIKLLMATYFLSSSVVPVVIAMDDLSTTQTGPVFPNSSPASKETNILQDYDYKDIFRTTYVIKNGNLTLAINREPSFANSFGQEEPIKVVDIHVYKKPENVTELNELYFDFKNRNNWNAYFCNYQIKFSNNGIARYGAEVATYKLFGVVPIRYVMGVDGHLYISNRDAISHSTLINGAYCLSAGMMLLNEEGKIAYFDNMSGHIQPSDEQFQAACKYLAYIDALSSNCKFSTSQCSKIMNYENLMSMNFPRGYCNSQVITIEGNFGISKEIWESQSLAPKMLMVQPITAYEQFLETYEKLKKSIQRVEYNISTSENEKNYYLQDENFQEIFPKMQELSAFFRKIKSLEGRISVLKRGDHPSDSNKTSEERLELISLIKGQLAELEGNIPHRNEPWMDYLVINGRLKM